MTTLDNVMLGRARQVAQSVPDPELPMVTLADLGILREVAVAALGWGASVRGVVDSGLPGPKGNREVFLALARPRESRRAPSR